MRPLFETRALGWDIMNNEYNRTLGWDIINNEYNRTLG